MNKQRHAHASYTLHPQHPTTGLSGRKAAFLLLLLAGAVIATQAGKMSLNTRSAPLDDQTIAITDNGGLRYDR